MCEQTLTFAWFRRAAPPIVANGGAVPEPGLEYSTVVPGGDVPTSTIRLLFRQFFPSQFIAVQLPDGNKERVGAAKFINACTIDIDGITVTSSALVGHKSIGLETKDSRMKFV